MADKKISELVSITGSATAADDFFVVVDTSGAVTHKISREELNNAIEQDVLSSIEITDITNDVNVQGTVTADGLTVEGAAKISGVTEPSLQLLESDTTDVNTKLANAAGDFRIYTVNDAGSEVAKRFQLDHPTGDISFYDSTGVTQGLFWDASTQRLGLGTTSPAQKLTVASEGRLRLYRSDNARYSDIYNNNSFLNIETSNDPIKINGQSYIRFDVSGSEAMRISSGNVGIGTSSPAVNFHAKNASGNLEIRFDSDTSRNIVFADNNGTYDAQIEAQANGTLYIATRQAQPMLFAINNSEAARIDSSGQLIVGHTGAGSPYFNEGIVLNPAGDSVFHRDGNSVVDFSRETSDGNIVRFVKDNSVVGSIGASVGDLYIGTGAHGLKFVDASTDIRPFNTSTGASSNGTTDLGNSTSRFKDIYLSGGVYLGGTGSANYLDDYEEGTWTATHGGNNMTVPAGLNPSYVKIGRLVTVCADVQSASGSSTTNTIGGLPFTSANLAGIAAVAYVTGSSAAAGAYISTVGTTINFIQNGGTSGANISAGDRIIFKAIYYTDA
jgi:hypothetical protein